MVQGRDHDATRASLGLPATGALEVAFRRDPESGTLVSVQRERTPLVVRGGEVVGDLLSEVLDELLVASGVRPDDPRVRSSTRGGVAQRCIEGLRAHGREIASCTAVRVDAAGEDLIVDVASCMGAEPDVCAAVIDSFSASGDAMAADTVLEATEAPGLQTMTPRGLAWIELGSERRAFHAACREAGQTIEDQRVLAQAPPAVQREVREGRLSVCGGEPWPSELGQVRTVHATFDESGRSIQFSLFVMASIDGVRPKVMTAYPDYLPEGDMTLHFVNREAAGDEVVALLVSPSISRPGETLVQVSSPLAQR